MEFKEFFLADTDIDHWQSSSGFLNLRLALTSMGVRLKPESLLSLPFVEPKLEPPYEMWRDYSRNGTVIKQGIVE